MSQLKVLIYGNHPNLALYTWRFQFAKSVDLYHVSDARSNEITIDTRSYGKNTFQLKNHFHDFAELQRLLQNESNKFDLVILSSSSLQDFSNITTQLNSVIMSNTKIFIESTGFVQLEPFIRMSISSPQVKVFSLMSDYDIREVSPENYVQFNPNSSGKQTIYIGETGSLKSQPGSSSYPKPITSLLTTFHSLFLKLFPDDAIDTCNFLPLDFLTQQWKLAIPRVCFDPLLILFEEFSPSLLHQQILAKPLISGLITEIITLTRTMGIKLPSGYDTESDLLKRWVAGNGQGYPSLLYHFEHKTAPLDIDLLLLQPILLADDFTIKTPYLEFLYSMMCQFKKLNNDESKLFTRATTVSKLQEEVSKLSLLNSSFQEKEASFAEELNQTKENLQRDIVTRDTQLSVLREQLKQEQSQNGSLRRQLSVVQAELNALKQARPVEHSVAGANAVAATLQTQSAPHTPVDSVSSRAIAGDSSSQPAEQYTDTGTPVLRDIEDIAVYGIEYNDSPAEDNAELNADKLEEKPMTAAVEQDQATVALDEHALRERELKLRRKELELQERELRLQKKQSQTMLNQKFNNVQNKSAMAANEYPAQYSSQMQMPNRKAHSQSAYMGKPSQGMPGQYIPPASQPPQMRPHVNTALPAMGHAPMNNNGARPLNGVGLPHLGLDGAAQIGGNGYAPKTFQKTSRKNRRSNMPMLRNPSNTMLNDYSMPTGPQSLQPGQQRYNSMSSNIPQLSTHYHGGSMPRLNNPNPNAMRASSQGQISSLPTQPQQQYQPVTKGMRQISTSTMIDEGVSTSSVVQRPPNGIPQQNQIQTQNQDQQERSNSNSNSNEHSTSPPLLDSDVSSNNHPSSSELNTSSVDLQDKQLAESNEKKNKEEIKKSKFSFFHSKKK